MKMNKKDEEDSMNDEMDEKSSYSTIKFSPICFLKVISKVRMNAK